MKKFVATVAVLAMMLMTLTGISVFADEPDTLPAETGTDVTTEATAEETTESTTEPEETTESTTEPEETPEEFSCYAYDEHGNVLNGFWDEADDTWYLFVTSTQMIGETELYYTGSISGVSAGTLDADSNTVTGAFAASSDSVQLTGADGQVYTVVMMQSGLPSIHITLEGTSLDEIHADKDKKHKGNNIYIMDPGGEYDLVVEGALEIKGRGNSTWREYEKKAYQIKFDEKTSILGMGKAKKWVLLANASDDSMMRTQLVYNMAKQMDMGFVCSLEYVDLWIDGEYRGTFLAGDKVEPGSSRLDLQNDAGALFEHDEAFYMEEDYWLYSTILGRHFVMKEIVEEEDAIIESAMTEFEAAVDELANYLYSTPSYQVTLEDLSAMIDVDSFVKYYLVNEYAMNRESFATSFYWYKDGPDDVIHLGPLWDFDTCMGNDGESFEASYGDEHVLFRNLLAAPAFYDRTEELLEQYRDVLAGMSADVDVLYEQIAASAEMNYIRWDVLGKPNPKGGADFYPTYDAAVDAVKQWLMGREHAFRVAECSVVTSVISDDCYDMALTFKDGNDYSDILFAVWSIEGGQDDVAWYPAMQDADGYWRFTADLGDHNSAGMYRTDAYTNGGKTEVGTGRNYVETARTSRYQINAVVSEDCTTMTVTMSDSGLCSKMTFAVWSEADGQNDLRWYDAQRGADGLWTYTVDMTKHQSAGEYFVHAYGTLSSGRRHLDDTTVYVARAVIGPAMDVYVSEDCTVMQLTLENVEGYDRIWVPVWSTEGGQDDLKWYEMTPAGQGTWTCTVDLCGHGSAGEYYIHVYGGSQNPNVLVMDTKAYVDKMPFRRVEATVSDDCCTMEVVIRNVDENWTSVWVPVWSEENAQDDIRWYEAAKQADGTWYCAVDLEAHGDSGWYFVHVYGGSQSPEQMLGDTTAYVRVVPGALPSVKVTVAMDEMTIVLKNIGDWANVWIPVWSEAGDQDDIQWYRPTRQPDGSWVAVVDLNDHRDVGLYHIHVYGGTDAAETQVAVKTVTVVNQPGTVPQMRTALNDGVLTVELINTGDWKNIWIPVWSEENGQDDLRWYQPVRQSDGSWLLNADLGSHGSLGNYAVHVYGGENAPTELLTYGTVYVDALEDVPVIRGSVSADGSKLTLTLSNAQDCDHIWIPVWSMENGADDQIWYEPALQTDGTWTVTVDLGDHSGSGIYHIHVYSGTVAPAELLTYMDMAVS